MVICTVEVNEKAPQTIVIGRRGTYNTQEIVFDIGYLIDTYGAGTAVLAIKRSQDSSAYPTVVAQEDTTLTWTVSETDTYYVGAGECELMWYVDGGLAKTIIYPMVVMRDILSTSEEAPDAYENWVESLTALGAETQQNALNAAQSATEAETAQGKAEDAQSAAEDAQEAAEEAAERAETAIVHAPVIQGGYWYIWNDGQYVNTNVRAEGEKGDKGDTGEKGDTGNGIASITKTGTAGLVDTYTVTYTDGTTTTFTVTNGAKGDKGDTGATGNGIASITKTGTSGNVDTYTITYTNGQTTTFTVTNGAVSSVAGKTGAVTLDANDVAFSESGTYDDGTVGKELSDQKNAISDLDEEVNDPVTGLATKAPVIINSASGDVASFADGADDMPIKSLVASIEPVQDLHGYDHPWPGGGNVNKLPAPADGTYTQNGITVTVKNGVYTFSGVSTANQYITFPALPSSANLSPSTNKIAFLNNFVDANVTFDFLRGDERIHYWGMTVTNRVATDWTDSDNENVDTIRIYCQTGFDGNGKTISTMLMSLSESDPTAFSPYANECPISGHTGCNVTRTGVNVFGGEAFADTIMEKVPDATIDTVNKTVTYSASKIQRKIIFDKFKPNTQYTIFLRNTGAANLAVDYTDGTRGEITVNGITVTNASKSVQRIIGEWHTGDTTVYYEDFGVFEGVLTADDFAPYTGTTIPITFPTTIYGGSDEVIGGALESNRGIFKFENYTGNISSDAANANGIIRYIATISNKKAGTSNLISNILATASYVIPQDTDKELISGFPSSAGLYMSIKASRLTGDLSTGAGRATALRSWAEANGFEICYELAAPIEYTLTANELTTLYGQNNVWTDVGEVSVDYPADTKLYIDNKIATAIANALNA